MMCRIDYTVLLSFVFLKNFTCPSGKLRTIFISPIANSTGRGLSDATFFARCYSQNVPFEAFEESVHLLHLPTNWSCQTVLTMASTHSHHGHGYMEHFQPIWEEQEGAESQPSFVKNTQNKVCNINMEPKVQSTVQDFVVYPPLDSRAMLCDIRSHVEIISIKGKQHVQGLS